jgi:hypothetical protein
MSGDGDGASESQRGEASAVGKKALQLLQAPGNYVAVVRGLCSIGRVGENGEPEAVELSGTPEEAMIAQLVDARGAKGSASNPHQVKRRSAITSTKPTIGAGASLDVARTGARRMTQAQFNVIRAVAAQRRATLWNEAAVLARNKLKDTTSYEPTDAVEGAVMTPDLVKLLEPTRIKRAAAVRAVLIYRTLSEALATNPSPSAEDEDAVATSREAAESATAVYAATFEEALGQPHGGEAGGSAPTTLADAMSMSSTAEEREACNQSREARRVRRGGRGAPSVAARPPVYNPRAEE